jgi:hypothetical protein
MALARQTDLASKLEAAATSAGMQAAELEELHRNTSMAYR